MKRGIRTTKVQKFLVNRLVRRPRLLEYAQKLRFLLMRGPLQNQIVRFYQKTSKTEPIALSEPGLFPDLDVPRVVSELNENGYSYAFQLPPEMIEIIMEHKSSLKSNHIRNLHKTLPVFDRITRDPKIIEVVRRYIGAEPILYATSLYYTGPESGNEGKTVEKNEKARIVHFDVPDFRHLNLFIYMTDVDEESSPHILYAGTHKHKTFRDLMTRWFTEKQINERFGAQRKMMTGKAGTAFFEDTSLFHIQKVGKYGRVVGLICYTLHRLPELSRYFE
jgi:hypothetical protein